jgi:hypothetical protein
MEKQCSFCGRHIDTSNRIGRNDSCPKCRRDLHACLQCRFYDENAYHQCLEPQAEWVSDKEKTNFCDYFEFGRNGSNEKAKEDVKTKLDALFRKRT